MHVHMYNQYANQSIEEIEDMRIDPLRNCGSIQNMDHNRSASVSQQQRHVSQTQEGKSIGGNESQPINEMRIDQYNESFSFHT